MSLPSLHALLVFETASRLGSFTRAAGELRVTQTAVSHQVKALENELGVALFRRSPRRLTLTPEGQAWAAELRPLFQRLRDVSHRLRSAQRAQRPLVAVTTIPSLGARWLVPRLGRFLAANPGVDVHISPSAELVDFGLQSFDVGIRFGQGPYPGLVSEKLADDAWIVVSAPALKSRSRLRSPRDLSRESLLGDDHTTAWDEWFAACGVGAVGVARSLFTDSSMVVEAAVRGQGVALARWSLACDELESGRLTLVFPRVPWLPTRQSYFLVGPRESFRRPAVAAFRDWLRQEARTLKPKSPATSA
jgi:LysR family transcriptional regulator, glycine cleavage system transcriptional activator